MGNDGCTSYELLIYFFLLDVGVGDLVQIEQVRCVLCVRQFKAG